MKHTVRVLVVALVTATVLGVFTTARAATPEGDFDQWVNDVHTFVGDLERGRVLDEIEAGARDEWLAAAALAEAEAAAREAAAAAARRTIPPQPSAARSSVGGHSDAWWHGVAICEQGGRNDPYYGYFSFMDGSQGGRSWDEQVAAGNALLARVGAESPAWAPSCVAAGYAASPGG